METLINKQTQFISLSSGRKLCYAEFGAENGIPLLYFHGWPSSRLQARAVHKLGKKLGITIYAPDRPGLGQSDNQEGRTLKDWPIIVEEFINHLNLKQPIHVQGVSGGGPYALATACALNNRIATTSIVCGAPPLQELPNRNEMIWPYRALLKVRPIIPAIMKPALPITKWIASKDYDEAPLSWFVKTLSKADQTMFGQDDTADFALYSFREAFSMDAPGLLIDADAYSERWNLDYSQITHPVHFWHGTADQNIPFSMAKHLASQIPNAITHWLEGEGHYTIPIKHSEKILATLQA